MNTVTIHDAKTNLSKYIAAAKKGKKIYIGGFGKPEVVLMKISRSESKPKNRDFSKLKGSVTYVSDDAFSEETDKEIEKLMLGEL